MAQWELNFCTLVARKSELWQVLRSTELRVPAFWWAHLVRFGGLKVLLCPVARATSQVYRPLCGAFTQFLVLRIRSLPIHETNSSRLHGFLCVQFQHFAAQIMRFLPSRENPSLKVTQNHVDQYLHFRIMKTRFMRCREIHDSFVGHFPHYGVEKDISAKSWKPTIQDYMYSCLHIFCNLPVRRFDFCRVMKSMFQGYVGTCEIIFYIFTSDNAIYSESWKPRCQAGCEFPCEIILCILVIWKCDFCQVVKPTVQDFLVVNFQHFDGLKMDIWRVLKLTPQGYLVSCELIFCTLAN